MKRFTQLCLAGAAALCAAPLRAATLSVLPIGDSITAGMPFTNGYREFLLNDLTAAGISIQFQGVLDQTQSNGFGYNANLVAENQNYNDGFVGYGTEDILDNLNQSTTSIYMPSVSNAGGYWITGGNGTGRSAVYPNIVLLMAGTNDEGDRNAQSTITTIETNFQGILNWFSANRPNTEVIIAAPPPGTGATDLPHILAVNSWLESVIPASYPQDRIANVYSAFLQANGSLNAAQVGPDGFHPSTPGCVGIADAFYDAIVASVGTDNAKALVQIGPLSISGTIGSWTSQIDLKTQDMIVSEGDLPTIVNQIKSGYNNGQWNGQGLTSSSASNNTTHLTTLGVMQNSDASGNAIYHTFDGLESSPADVLIKYTYYGDANLDGKVDASDYSLIDNGCLNHLTGWFNGDFNYDGIINGSDYTLIDNAFNHQSAIITAQLASLPASVPEPLNLGLISAAAMGLLARRSKR